MNRLGRALVAAATVTFGVGLALAFVPGVGGLRLDRIILPALGGLALFQAFRVVRNRSRLGIDRAETPDPELPRESPPPGDDLDDVLAEFVESRIAFTRSRIHEGLESVAIAALTRYGGCDETEARERVAAGDWTDDPYAAAFLGDRDVSLPPLRDRLRYVVRLIPPMQRDIRHTVDAVAAVAGIDPLPTDDDLPTDAEREAIGDSTNRFDLSAVDDDNPPAEQVAERRSTGHWRGVSAIALVSIGIGVLTEVPAVLLAGAVGLGFGAYARMASAPAVAVAVDRVLDDPRPQPGDDVRVTVSVRNEGDRPLWDLRFVDGVPDGLAVSDGSPRYATPLRPGEERSFAYSVAARRGEHAFGPLLVVAADLTSGIEEERLVRSETALTCVPELRPTAVPVPLRRRVTQYAGQVDTTRGGEGVEFHATREYRLGDPLSRIDWNRRARTGEFATLEFREERAATVVVVIDARSGSYVSPTPHAPHALDRCVHAASRVIARLLESGNRVGLDVLGSTECWHRPGTRSDHRDRVRRTLALDPALPPLPSERRFMPVRWERRIRRRLPGDAQVVFVSPLADWYSARAARRLDASGYPVTAIAPNPAADRTPSQRLARVARAMRVTDLRTAGVRVVDWAWDEPLDVALIRGTPGGSA